MDRHRLLARILVSLVALALLIARVVLEFPLEATDLGLVVLALLPWLSSIISSAELPGGWKIEFLRVEQEQMRQRTEIDTLKLLVHNFVTGYELTHLKKLAGDEPFPFTPSNSFEAELRRLLAMGLVERLPGRGIRTLFNAQDDVREHLKITDQGRTYLELRADSRIDDPPL